MGELGTGKTAHCFYDAYWDACTETDMSSTEPAWNEESRLVPHAVRVLLGVTIDTWLL